MTCLFKFDVIFCTFEGLIDLRDIHNNFSSLIGLALVIVLPCYLRLAIPITLRFVFDLFRIVLDYLMIGLAILIELFVSHISYLDVMRDLRAALHRDRLLALVDIALHVGWGLRAGSCLGLFHSYYFFWTSLNLIGL